MIVIAASVFLGAVFIVSAVTKIAAMQQWRGQAAGLGVSGLVVGGLPYAELGIGTLLVAQIARRPVAIVAGLVLLAFTTLLVARLAQGRRPPCACFGGLSSKPISWTSVVRNALFIALAALVALV